MPIRAAEPGDIDAVHELLAARNRAALGAAELGRGEVELAFSLPGTTRLVAAEPDVVGYGSLDSAHRIELAAPTTADSLLGALLERARTLRIELVHAIVAEHDAPFREAVRRAGFEHRGDVLRMWATATGAHPEPCWPDGVSARTFEPADAHRVQALLDDAYRWDETHEPRPHGEWLRWMTEHDEFDPALWLLAEREGELAGAALLWRPVNGRGWVKDLAVRADERGRGLGGALLRAGLRASAERGAARVGLKVDSTNPTGAIRLYERLGFAVDRRDGIWVKAP